MLKQIAKSSGNGTMVGVESIHWAQIDSKLIEIGAVVHSNGVEGENVHVGSGAVVGPSVTIGHSTKIGYNVSLSNCRIGESMHNPQWIIHRSRWFSFPMWHQLLNRPAIVRRTGV
ncbi:hypothetical protein CDL15_Pgr017079 [Punica granatum]|uniref:Uncharacterized protein n=2 Tax=Punica granatum TaxID=22663 RepID=A0A218WYT3_PUNGR|nr:hypothetical protein CDL15_Pgr017079 [Punica granatum]